MAAFSLCVCTLERGAKASLLSLNWPWRLLLLGFMRGDNGRINGFDRLCGVKVEEASKVSFLPSLENIKGFPTRKPNERIMMCSLFCVSGMIEEGRREKEGRGEISLKEFTSSSSYLARFSKEKGGKNADPVFGEGGRIFQPDAPCIIRSNALNRERLLLLLQQQQQQQQHVSNHLHHIRAMKDWPLSLSLSTSSSSSPRLCFVRSFVGHRNTFSPRRLYHLGWGETGPGRGRDGPGMHCTRR